MRYFFLASALFSVSACAADGLCHDLEQTIFSCTIHKSSKLLSVCASPVLDKAESYIQYRFGTPKKIELKFPAEQKNSIPQFKFAHYFRFRVDRTELSFSTGSYRYAVFHFYEGDIEPSETREGITVSKSGEQEKETEILCEKPPINHLHLLENIIPCDRESALASCE